MLSEQLISDHQAIIARGRGRGRLLARTELIDSQIMALNQAIIGQAALELSGVIDSERVAAYHLRLDATQYSLSVLSQ